MKCDLCDQEFDTEAQLDEHKAKMHASEENPQMPADDLEVPDYKRAVNE